MKYVLVLIFVSLLCHHNYAQFPDTDPQFSIHLQSEFNDNPNSTMTKKSATTNY
jgi:hypothetical protein